MSKNRRGRFSWALIVLPLAAVCAPTEPTTSEASRSTGEAVTQFLCPEGSAPIHEHDPIGTRLAYCERDDGVRHGAFRAYWSHGELQLEGTYDDGNWRGLSSVHLPSGARWLERRAEFDGKGPVSILDPGEPGMTPWLNPVGASRIAGVPSRPIEAPRLAVVKSGEALDSSAMAHARAMVEKARENDLRVIIGLRVDFEPEGNLPKEALFRQRASIGEARTRIGARLAEIGAAPVRELDPLPFVAVVAGESALAELIFDPDVVSIQEDGLNYPLLNQSVPLIGGGTAQAAGADGTGAVVAILDTGVSLSHPYFSGRIVSQACYSTNNSSSGATSLCPGGATSSTASGSGDACSGTIYGCDHGTQVGGIAAGKSSTYGGVAPESGIIAIQVFTRFDHYHVCGPYSPCVAGYDSDWLAGMNRVATLSSSFPIAAVNLSLGGGYYSSYCDSSVPSAKSAIDNLRSQGIASIVATGNDGYTSGIAAPSCVSSAIAVGSTTKQDAVSSFSNSANILDLLAPGSSITAPTIGGGTMVSDGTSLASPHVAGAWTALRSAVPNATVNEIFVALRDTGVSVSDTRVSPPRVKPRIRVDLALDALGGPVVEVDTPSMQPAGGAFESPVVVTLSSPTSGASIRYTTNGNNPTPTSGNLIANGGSLTLNQSATLKAIAYTSSTDFSEIAEGEFRVRSRLRVDVEPLGAVTAGAAWRQKNISAESFESGAFDRYDWNFTGHGTWQIGTTSLPGFNYAYSPPLGHGQSASLHLDFVSDGGDVVFVAAVSSEENGDQLCFFVDGTQRGCWSGERDWMQLSFPVGAGSRALRWTYSKDQSVSDGLDAAFLSVIQIPGDQWRSPGQTLGWLRTSPDQMSTRIAYKATTGWNAPAEAQVSLPAGQTTQITGEYTMDLTVAAPVIMPPGGTYTQAQQVSMSTSTDGAVIRYTTNGTSPTESSTIFTAPFTVPEDSTVTVRARAYRDGWNPSSITEAVIRVTGTVVAPSFTPSPGTYSSPIEVALSTSTPQATIRYTTDGSQPGPSSPAYQSPIPIGEDSVVTIRARGYRQDWSPSQDVSGIFEVAGRVSTPVFVPEGIQNVMNGVEVEIRTVTTGADLRYTLDGTSPSETSPLYQSPILLAPGESAEICARGYRNDLQPSGVACEEYSAAPRVPAPVFSPPPGAYGVPPTVSISCADSEATIRYRMDGTEPAGDSPVYTAPIELEDWNSTELRAIALRDGFSDSEIASGRYDVFPLIRLLDENDEPIEEVMMERGERVFFKIDGGTGDYSFEIVVSGDRPRGEIEDVDGGHRYIAPSEGAFAGRREIVVRDVSGAIATLLADVALQVFVEPAELQAGSSDGRVRVLGAEPGTVHAMSVVDMGEQAFPDAGKVIRQMPAEDAPLDGNPAEASIRVEESAAGVSLRVRASFDDTSGISGSARVVSGHTNGDGGCGCQAASSGPGAGMVLALLGLSIMAARPRRHTLWGI